MASIGGRLRNFHRVRKIVYFFVGLFSWPGLAVVNKIQISGTEHIRYLPRRRVLFVSNHQTYFADVITFLHIFCAVKWGKKDSLLFVTFKPALDLDYEAPAEHIMEQVMDAIEQSKKFMMMGKHHWLTTDK